MNDNNNKPLVTNYAEFSIDIKPFPSSSTTIYNLFSADFWWNPL